MPSDSAILYVRRAAPYPGTLAAGLVRDVPPQRPAPNGRPSRHPPHSCREGRRSDLSPRPWPRSGLTMGGVQDRYYVRLVASYR